MSSKPKSSPGLNRLSKVIANSLSFSWPDGTPVFGNLNFSLSQRRTALIGRNGAGKSTLMEIIAGRRTAQSGTLHVEGAPFYLPQRSFESAPRTSVQDILGATPVLAALKRLKMGDSHPSVFEAIGDQWDIEDKCRSALRVAGLNSLSLDTPVAPLSAGQIVRLKMTLVHLLEPDILLLDEPTNHLDRDARETLQELMDSFPGLVLMISHDRELLERVNEIWDLRGGNLFVYGGGYSFYRNARQQEVQAAEHRLHETRLQIKKRISDAESAKERQQKRIARGNKSGLKSGLPRIVRGALKRRAQQTLGKVSLLHELRVTQAESNFEAAKKQVDADEPVRLSQVGVKISSNKNWIEARDFNLIGPNGERFWEEPLNFCVRGGERVAIEGANGSGKSTLLRLIKGDKPYAGLIATGELLVRAKAIGYMDQTLDFLNREESLLEAFQHHTPHLTESERRIILARHLFPGDVVHRSCLDLSGGEKIRLGLACVLNSRPEPEILLLDEPTNNLDLFSIERLEQTLREIPCSLVFISHDRSFLDHLALSNRIPLRRIGD